MQKREREGSTFSFCMKIDHRRNELKQTIPRSPQLSISCQPLRWKCLSDLGPGGVSACRRFVRARCSKPIGLPDNQSAVRSPRYHGDKSANSQHGRLGCDLISRSSGSLRTSPSDLCLEVYYLTRPDPPLVARLWLTPV